MLKTKSVAEFFTCFEAEVYKRRRFGGQLELKAIVRSCYLLSSLPYDLCFACHKKLKFKRDVNLNTTSPIQRTSCDLRLHS